MEDFSYNELEKNIDSDLLETRIDETYQHCLEVAVQASVLAERCHVEPVKARVAGLIHDWSYQTTNE